MEKNHYKETFKMGSGCGSVGREVAFDSRGPRFESHHWQKFILNILLSTEKTKIKKKRPGRAHLFKKRHLKLFFRAK